ncbi:M48 family metallopeptidase [Paenibacillus guangzhouensis]|uniref:M48 family metallopeptidase n=1 Tax=Paenibacillus guangzhouensis TaxID=1473112 RepID=UPI0012673E71|nr:SprT family zinc-dependent metalloprotease [Paenibacillus guangzhouensis]
MKIELEQQVIDVHVEYGPRKKLSIHIDPSGLITVKAPNRTSDDIVISAVKQHGSKIVKQLQAIEAARQPAPNVRSYEEEGKFLHLGRYYTLQELIATDGLTEEELQRELKKFYFASCKKVIGERLKIYQKQLKVTPKSYLIEESLTKWGSCSSAKHLTFNYRLAMAPIDVIDYVVIHELCHLLHMNHDRSFWRRVGSIMPDYKEKEAFLAKYGQAMTL